MAKQKDKNRGETNLTATTNNGSMVNVNNGTINYISGNAEYSPVIDSMKDSLSKLEFKLSLNEQAIQRTNTFIGKILSLVSNRLKPEELQKLFEDPSFLIDFTEAGKSYIKYGTAELLDVLSKIINERINETQYSLLQIAISETIKTAPLLLKEQMNTLALAFVLMHTINLNVNSLATLKKYLKEIIIPIFNNGVSEKQSEFQHLSYARCATISAFIKPLTSIFEDKYTGLFSNGFSESDIPIINGKRLSDLHHNLFIKCLNDNTKYQINAVNSKQLKDKIVSINEKDKKEIEKLFNKNKMNETSIKLKIIEICPEMEKIIDYWDNNTISHLTLSSVGIIIGAITSSNITNNQYDLKIWI